MTRIKRVFARGALAVIVAVSMVDVALAIPNTVSNVPTGRADAVDTNNLACSVAPFFVDMPNMSKSFSFGGTASQRVIALFEGQWGAFTEGSGASVRLLIDRVAQSGQGNGIRVDSRPSGEPFTTETHGFNFVSDLLAPGTHTATLQGRDNGAGPVCVSFRSLIVLHR